MIDEAIRQLVRLADSAESVPEFDIESGLREVVLRVRVGTRWAHLEGRERHAACLLAARDGDQAAFAALINDLSPLVWHVARSNGLGRAEAEDVVQTVWLALVRSMHRLTDPRALAAWLITTARREANHSSRLSQRTRTVDLGDPATGELAAPDPSPEDQVLRRARDRALWLAFDRLTPRCRELLRLTVLAGRAEYRAVAEELGIPVGSIGPTRRRCLSLLQRYYEQENGR
jgi:RNA polymerase sigma factor (sigma-70 family)